ncbi:MAG: Gfo/Idh/MocA family oxidoreductase [Streptosporangiaceae bacterium]|jgi:predicted dehydrogenase/threonine dehydrogenase-like Zn-dependent dehydrogenase
MKQIVQPVSGGPVKILEVPRPVISPAEVLVRTVASVISPGTEGAVTALARSSLLAKARARPDLVRQVVRKARAEGLAVTAQAVRSRLASDVPLGYSAAGVVAEVGSAVDGIKVGQLVATGGAGQASHAEFQAVPWLLCAAVPDGVPAADAAFATLASIPLHALRLSGVGPGAKVVVLGLGLLGQLAARLAMASGCDVAGIDPGGFVRDTAVRAGVLALDETGDTTTEAILRWSRGRGADAVLVCAADSSAGPMSRAPALCRDRACVVMVGDVGMPPQRTPFYEREISLLFARSYGPGRYEPSYEAWGVDYPVGQVRWTEGRNQEAVLDLLAVGRLHVSDLVTQTFGIEGADEAYRLLEKRTEPCLAIRLSYPSGAAADEPVRLRPRVGQGSADHGTGASRAGEPGVGWIGAGAFSTGTLLPAFREAGFARFVAVATASGVSARRAAERHGFEQAVTGAAAVIGDPDVSVVVITTPHDTHEELACQALAAGRDVWCEKPLALTLAGLDEVEKAWRDSGRRLTLGFNRRWAPSVQAAQRALAGEQGPKLVVYRIAAGRVPEGHWYLDRRQGGRLLGEVCHFVDTAQALVGVGIEEATGLLSGDASQGNDSVVAALRFADGSVASIAYGSTPPVAGKERIEVLAGSHQVIIDDFRSVLVDGRTRWKGRPDKGHRAHAAAFRQAVQAGADMPTEAMLSSMRATIQTVDRVGSA